MSIYSDSGQPDAFEAHDSRGVKVTAASGGNSQTIKAFVVGTNDRDEAYAKLLTHISNVLLINNALPVVADSIDLQWHGEEAWVATIEYVSPQDTQTSNQPRAIGEVTFEFDGTGGKTEIKYAYAQRRYPEAPDPNTNNDPDARDYGTAINVDDENKPQGVEIVVPQVRFSLHQAFEGPTITLPWLRQVIFLTGCVNDRNFLGFGPGEVLFLGPSGQQPLKFMDNGAVVAGDRDVTFQFAVSPNVTGLKIGDIKDINKRGHEYLWTKSVQELDTTSGTMKDKPIGVYVATVYRPADFTVLGINNPDRFAPVAGA